MNFNVYFILFCDARHEIKAFEVEMLIVGTTAEGVMHHCKS